MPSSSPDTKPSGTKAASKQEPQPHLTGIEPPPPKAVPKKEPTEAEKARVAAAIVKREASEAYLARWRTLKGDPKARFDDASRGAFGRLLDARGLPDLIRALEGLHSDPFTAAWPMLQCLSEASIQRGLAQATKATAPPPFDPRREAARPVRQDYIPPIPPPRTPEEQAEIRRINEEGRAALARLAP